MQTASPRIWALVSVSISYKDNHYTKCTYIYCIYTISSISFVSLSLSLSPYIYIYIYMCVCVDIWIYTYILFSLTFFISLYVFKVSDLTLSNTIYIWKRNKMWKPICWSIYILVWFLCLMAYQSSWVIQCQSHPSRSWMDKRVHMFPQGICLKVNVIAWLGVWTCLLQICSPALQPLHHKDTANLYINWNKYINIPAIYK